jgi:putative phosphoesterase
VASIGVVADTHDAIVPWDPVGRKVADLFAGVDLIVHCGDITTPAVLDQLATVAPVVAVRGADDPPPDPPRLTEPPRIVDHGGHAIGVVVALAEDGPPVADLFDRPVSVVLHGGTHEAGIEERDGVLLVNPGSPTLADRTTVAVVGIDGPEVTARILDV